MHLWGMEDIKVKIGDDINLRNNLPSLGGEGEI